MMISSASASDLESLWLAIQSLLSAGRWRDAEVTLRAAADTINQPEIRLTLGALYAERGELRLAISQWMCVIEAAQAAGRRDLLAAVYHNLAALYRDQGAYDIARRFQQRSLTWQADCGPDDLLQLANDAMASQAYDIAESLLKEAQQLSPSTTEWKATIQASSGLLSGLRGNPGAGIRSLKAAYRKHRSEHNRMMMAQDLGNLAALYEQQDQWRAAEACLLRAVAYYRELNLAWWQQGAEKRLMRLRNLRAIRATPVWWN